MNWYRLIQTDFDNQSKYSPVISVLIDQGQQTAYLYPVPARDQLTVFFSTAVINTRIELLSADLRMLRKETISNLTYKKDINVSGLPAGMYFIRVTGPTGTRLLRFIKE